MILACDCTRRTVLAAIAAAGAAVATKASAVPEQHREFIAAAFRMRDEAVRAGDQPYGAVVVKDGRILGFGPSRVVLKKDPTAHAEREAIREAQARLGRSDLSGAMLYSSSRPCAACETAAADANIARMIHGSEAADAAAQAPMIDHVSIAVRDLAGCGRFYEAVLAAIGYTKLVIRPGTIGFGKKYPELWINERRAMMPVDADTGTHICLRASSIEAVQAFHAAAVQNGGASDGAPGPRQATMGGYYAAFIRDPEGNKIEAATFTAPQA